LRAFDHCRQHVQVDHVDDLVANSIDIRFVVECPPEVLRRGQELADPTLPDPRTVEGVRSRPLR
jgi:hypothetical protein